MTIPAVGDWVEYPAHWDTQAQGKHRLLAVVVAVYGLEVVAEVASPERQRGAMITDHYQNFLKWEQMTF